MTYPVIKFPDNCLAAGQYTFPFSIDLPNWIPASMMFSGSHEQAKFSIQYQLRAQFVPLNQCDWAAEGVSNFRTEKDFCVLRP